MNPEIDDLDDEFSEFDEDFGLVERRNLTQLKKEHQLIQQRVLELALLPKDKRKALPLDEDALRRLTKISTMKPSGARNREVRFVSKFWPHWDIEALDKHMKATEETARNFREMEKRIELWRERLLSENAALTDFMLEWPVADAQGLRQLIRAARKEAELSKPPASARKLFRQLRAIMLPS